MYPEIHYKRDGQQITVCGCYGQDPEVRLPDRIEGLPVTAIAAYAFAQTEEEKGLSVFRDDAYFRTEKEERLCGGRVTSVALPDWTERIGNYAFYRCFRLKELEFTDSLVDIGGGAFTGCQLERIRISCRNSQKTCLKQILEEQRFLLDVRIRYESPDGKTQTAHLIFPEHYEEAVENTPARIVSTQYHGSGGDYRQCIYNREIRYEEYDALFEKAKIQETKETAVKIAVARVTEPYRLGQRAKEDYAAFIREECRTAMKIILSDEDEDVLRILLQERVFQEMEMKEMLDETAKAGHTEFTAILMEAKRKIAHGTKKKSFDL